MNCKVDNARSKPRLVPDIDPFVRKLSGTAGIRGGPPPTQGEKQGSRSGIASRHRYCGGHASGSRGQQMPPCNTQVRDYVSLFKGVRWYWELKKNNDRLPRREVQGRGTRSGRQKRLGKRTWKRVKERREIGAGRTSRSIDIIMGKTTEPAGGYRPFLVHGIFPRPEGRAELGRAALADPAFGTTGLGGAGFGGGRDEGEGGAGERDSDVVVRGKRRAAEF
ncbi:hypothetical protein B0H11DRAFT_1927964 [Mycena galericulata]|nr:hypothetical protein B0H11DRAFT_1927964 [Mycena galericulata]